MGRTTGRGPRRTQRTRSGSSTPTTRRTTIDPGQGQTYIRGNSTTERLDTVEGSYWATQERSSVSTGGSATPRSVVRSSVQASVAAVRDRRAVTTSPRPKANPRRKAVIKRKMLSC